MMVMTLIMIMIMLIAIMVGIPGLQEFRLDIEDAIEIEGIAAQHGVQRNLGALRLVERQSRLSEAVLEKTDAVMAPERLAVEHEDGNAEKRLVQKEDSGVLLLCANASVKAMLEL